MIVKDIIHNKVLKADSFRVIIVQEERNADIKEIT